jgi:hypothetical protein
VNDDLVQIAEEIIFGICSFTISEFSCEFPQISGTILWALCETDSENSHGCKLNAENGFSFDICKAIPQRW